MGFLFSISSTDIFRDSFIASWIYTILDGGTPLRSSSELNFPWTFLFFAWIFSMTNFFEHLSNREQCKVMDSSSIRIGSCVSNFFLNSLLPWIFYSSSGNSMSSIFISRSMSSRTISSLGMASLPPSLFVYLFLLLVTGSLWGFSRLPLRGFWSPLS